MKITLNKIGSVETKSYSKGYKNKLVSDTEEFLSNLAKNFAKQSAKYIEAINEAPFVYKEKQLVSLLGPALDKISDAFIAEHPLVRRTPVVQKKKTTVKENIGWVDYWVRKDETDFYIEVKHDFNSLNSINVGQRLKNNWAEMNRSQLKTIQEASRHLSQDMKNIILMSLHIVIIYDYVKIDKNYRYSKYIQSYFDDIHKEFEQHLSEEKPSWSAMWMLHDNLLQQSLWENDTHHEFYPAVLFFSKFQKVN